MQYLIYPTKVMNISQSYSDNFSHRDSSLGKPRSYPIDEACASGNNAFFYAPCDLIVKRIYGVEGKGTNTIWLQSVDKVVLANGTSSFVTILVMHPNDKSLKKFKVNQIYRQYAKMFEKGDDGNATGKHMHIEVSLSKYSDLPNNGWTKNNRGMWVISGKTIKPEQAFLIDPNFTKVVNKGGLNFKYVPLVIENYYPLVRASFISFVDALKMIKVDSSFINRSRIANKNGINAYIGSSDQNTKLLNLLKKGKLKK